MNPEEQKIYDIICSFNRPVSTRELRTKLTDTVSFQRAIWRLVDINKIEFTVDSKVKPKETRIITAKKVTYKPKRSLNLSSCTR